MYKELKTNLILFSKAYFAAYLKGHLFVSDHVTLPYGSVPTTREEMSNNCFTSGALFLCLSPQTIIYWITGYFIMKEDNISFSKKPSADTHLSTLKVDTDLSRTTFRWKKPFPLPLWCQLKTKGKGDRHNAFNSWCIRVLCGLICVVYLFNSAPTKIHLLSTTNGLAINTQCCRCYLL